MIVTESVARKLLIASARRHHLSLSEDASSVALSTGLISAGPEGGAIETALGTTRFSAQDSVDLALFVVRMDEALAAARGDFEERHAERLLQALWAIENITSTPAPPSPWRKLHTTAGMIAAGWETGMVEPPLPVTDRDILKVATMLRIDRFRGQSPLFGLVGKEGRTTVLAARRPSGTVNYWSGPLASSNFMDAIGRLPGSHTATPAPANRPRQ